ncbi:hypothetical protein [Massilia rhizosphaerae]|uniref:hypothetical protein n=1 Tax=Massilia rhizosphaerae TaxID=2784389 RepID=UPI0018DC8FC0|nr:hypothetical protein [Massilia rhizosphaerae]
MKIKSMKPRNPHAVAAKQRNAGAHGAYQAERRQRRTEKRALRSLVTGQDRDGKEDV